MKLLCDEMLKGLARWLRAAGYDTVLPADGQQDAALLARAVAEDRLLITRDFKLTEFREAPGRVVWLRCEGLDDCARALGAAVPIDWQRAPFSRCLVCNTPVEPAPLSRWAEAPPEAQRRGGPLSQCPACGRLYWEGSHVRRMRRKLAAWQAGPLTQTP